MACDVEIDLSLVRGDFAVSVSFRAAGGVSALVGPSGIGKSTVLAMVAGLTRPDGGRVVVGGEVWFDAASGINLPPERRACGVVFQDHRLFPHMRVAANLRYGMGRHGRGRGTPVMGLVEMARFLGIEALMERWPRSLSGGEAQRVAIGRALLSSPRLLLMDEPLSSLDEGRSDEIMGLIEQIRDRMAIPILYVSHDRGEVERLADRQIDMKKAAQA